MNSMISFKQSQLYVISRYMSFITLCVCVCVCVCCLFFVVVSPSPFALFVSFFFFFLVFSLRSRVCIDFYRLFGKIISRSRGRSRRRDGISSRPHSTFVSILGFDVGSIQRRVVATFFGRGAVKY